MRYFLFLFLLATQSFAQSPTPKYCAKVGACANPCAADSQGKIIEFNDKQGAYDYVKSQDNTFKTWNSGEGVYFAFPNKCYQKNYDSLRCFTCNGAAFAYQLGCPAGTVPNYTTEKCDCPAPKVWDSYKKFCTSPCPDGSAPKDGTCPVNPKALGPSCPEAGNPIGISAANKFQIETDADFGVLKIQRTYNSGDDGESDPGGFGRKWIHYYDRSLFSSGDAAFVRRPDGKRLSFINQGGVFFSDKDIPDTITKLSNGGFEYRNFSDDSVETYNSLGKLMSIKDRQGRLVNLAYDTNNRLSKVTDYFGNSLTFTWSTNYGAAKIVSITHSNGQMFEYFYDSDWRFFKVKFPSGKTRIYHYEYPGDLTKFFMTGITNEDGLRYVTWSYSNGYPVSSSGIAGNVTVGYRSEMFKEDTVNNTPPRVDVNDNGVSKSYTFEKSQGLMRVKSVSSGTASVCSGPSGTTFSYDLNGFVTATTDAKGKKTIYSRDNKGREISRTEAVGTEFEKTVTTEYHPQFNAITKITESGKVTSFNYDDRGNLLEKRIAYNDGSAPQVWSYTYNDLSLLVSENGPGPDIDDKFTYEYDSSGRMISKTDVLGRSFQFEYDLNNRVTKTIDPLGDIDEKTYDGVGRVLTQKLAHDQKTFTYDTNGRLSVVTHADGKTETYTYGADGKLSSFINRMGLKEVYTYNNGQLAKTERFDPNNNLLSTSSEVYDNLNKTKETVTNGFSVKRYFNNACEVIKTTDSLSRANEFTYNLLGQRTMKKDALGGASYFSYDSNGKMREVKDPRGIITKYNFDSYGQLTKEESPDAGVKLVEYQNFLPIKTTDARGVASVKSYDSIGRLSQISAQNTFQLKKSNGVSPTAQASTTQLLYNDGVGKVRSIQNADSKLDYIFSNGKVASKNQNVGGKNLKILYEYDLNGKLNKMTYPSGKIVELSYNSGTVSKITVDGVTLVDQVTYNSIGKIKSWSWGNGGSINRDYNSNGGLSSYTLGSGQATLSYDLAQRPTTIFNPINNLSDVFKYDFLDRIIQVLPPISQDYSFDANHNRTDIGRYPASQTSNRLNASDVTYDKAGNMTRKGKLQLFYNLQGRLSSVVQLSKGTELKMRAGFYLYNGLGERVLKKNITENGSEKTYYVYDESSHVIGEYGENSQQEFIYIDEVPVAALAKDQIFYIESDHLGTPRALKNQANKIVWTWFSDPFGSTLPDEDADKDGKKVVFNLRFPGQVYDQESGLHYNYNRDYDPSLGRYVESDPKGLQAGLNTYAYVSGSPTTKIDPLGLEEEDPTNYPPTVYIPGGGIFVGNPNDPVVVKGGGYFSKAPKDPPGVCTIYGHGDSDFFADMTPSEAAPLIQAICGTDPCTKIRLMSCGTGGNPNGAAQGIASITGQQVTAPTAVMYILNNGGTEIENGGTFKTFYPKRGPGSNGPNPCCPQ